MDRDMVVHEMTGYSWIRMRVGEAGWIGFKSWGSRL